MSNQRLVEPIYAYAFLGWMLGTIPPAILFLAFGVIQHFRLKSSLQNADLGGLVFILLLLAICSFAGLVMGFLIGAFQMIFREKSWIWAALLSPIYGFIWAILTGGAGGFLVFIVGAFFGAFAALPYGIAGFTIFAFVYEPLFRRRTLRVWQVVLLILGIAILLSAVITPLIMFLLFGRELQRK